MSGSNSSNRSMKDIVCDATERELKIYSEKKMTPEELKIKVAAAKKRKRKSVYRAVSVAALFLIVLISSLIVLDNWSSDVTADKKGKTETVTEDGVIIEDGGWDSSAEDKWILTDWDEVKEKKSLVTRMVLPEHIPKGYRFKEAVIEGEGKITNIYYYYTDNNDELTIQECIYDEQLISTQISKDCKVIDSVLGKIYIKEEDGINNAIFHLEDDIVLYIWTTCSDEEIIAIIENLKI